MNLDKKIEFNFFDEINDDYTYARLFPQKTVGLAIVFLYEKVIAGDFINNLFTEKNIHDAFIKVRPPTIRLQKEDYSAYIHHLQEYFLDYDQESQRYFFKDYAYKFCEHAKTTLKGAFNPTRIKQLCSDLIKLLKDIDNDNDLQNWLENQYKRFEPELREQIDFLEKQIANSVEQLKKESNFTEHKFIDVLKSVEDNLDIAQEQSRELRSAYEETKTIRNILDTKDIDDNYINDLITEVHLFIRLVNARLNTIDRKLERIQPRIRQLFSTLNRPRFNSKIQKFTRYLLDKSSIEYINSSKSIVFPFSVPTPKLHIEVPNFTVLRKDLELFPPKPKKLIKYPQNLSIVERNKLRTLKVIERQEKISVWENYIISEIELRQQLNLSEVFYKILNEDNDSEIAITVLFNIVVKIRKDKKLELTTYNQLETNEYFKNIALWKMEVTKTK
ncbi:hypothetical protein Q4Q39_01960 [Flavivirga amylovorans]|uniref:DUF3375 domain-containing protein n=1 Tax=Flavivirga amylovorans TaxID=870486 RepID=A0ABT8WWU6_9FLAO|nr:hypothetical protein [Flavivirga amylovorans]MDO5986156.1 hypothetical protein [Flavivirga amylovorans]